MPPKKTMAKPSKSQIATSAAELHAACRELFASIPIDFNMGSILAAAHRLSEADAENDKITSGSNAGAKEAHAMLAYVQPSPLGFDKIPTQLPPEERPYTFDMAKAIQKNLDEAGWPSCNRSADVIELVGNSKFCRQLKNSVRDAMADTKPTKFDTLTEAVRGVISSTTGASANPKFTYADMVFYSLLQAVSNLRRPKAQEQELTTEDAYQVALDSPSPLRLSVSLQQSPADSPLARLSSTSTAAGLSNHGHLVPSTLPDLEKNLTRIKLDDLGPNPPSPHAPAILFPSTPRRVETRSDPRVPSPPKKFSSPMGGGHIPLLTLTNHTEVPIEHLSHTSAMLEDLLNEHIDLQLKKQGVDYNASHHFHSEHFPLTMSFGANKMIVYTDGIWMFSRKEADEDKIMRCAMENKRGKRPQLDGKYQPRAQMIAEVVGLIHNSPPKPDEKRATYCVISQEGPEQWFLTAQPSAEYVKYVMGQTSWADALKKGVALECRQWGPLRIDHPSEYELALILRSLIGRTVRDFILHPQTYSAMGSA